MIWVLPLFWAACLAAGYLYTQPRGVPFSIILWVAPAFLLEATLFLSMGLEQWRTRLERRPKLAIAALLTLAAAAPYALAVLPFNAFEWSSFGALLLLGGLVAGWYLVLPAHPASDIALLATMAAVMLLKPFPLLYPRPHAGLALEALGQAMWIRTGLYAMLSVRRVKGVGFGFWPTKREWRIGAVHFVVLLPLAIGLGWWIRFTAPQTPQGGPIETLTTLVLTFFGALWVLALGEEFFFRGLLQQWLSGWLGSDWAGLAAASVLFGSVHLWYHEFPNWRFALLATLAGVFYGLAYKKANGIRAAMVTHAATVTTWKLFFSQ